MNQTHEDASSPPVPQDTAPLAGLATRSVLGGTLMGLANLVPGISGGTMLLAAGIYPRFINAIAEVTMLRFRWRSMLTLGLVVASALAAIVLLANTIKGWVVDHRWVMYSIFIGLTLGGVPVVWRMIQRCTGSVVVYALAGFVGMAILAWYQMQGAAGDGANTGFAFMLLAGAVAASAMILPGVSGAYLFLVLGVYIPVLAGVDALKQAIGARDAGAAMEPMLTVVLPIGIGVVIGVVAVSNALRWVLARYEKPALGFLLGLLMGAVVGLWPFQAGVQPQVGDVFKGRVVTVETVAEIKPEDYPTAFFRPTGGQIGGAIVLMLGGFATTVLVARLGRDKG